MDHSILNLKQLEAVKHVEGPMLVIAGAGSGKTRVVTHRILHLLSLGVSAAEILAVTFTNKAAEEMSHRIQNEGQAYVLTTTFHSLCARILHESIDALGYTHHFKIFDEEDSEKVLKECFQEKEFKDEKATLKAIRKNISAAKNNLIEPEELAKEDNVLATIYANYQKKLKSYNALDFDDLLFLTAKLFKEFPDVLKKYQTRWRFILIDEYQDTNHVQYILIKLLSDIHKNVFAVGDPDQSIYSWRGANIHNILNFEKDFPGAHILSLEQNYRSKTNILKAANHLIDRNLGRHKKTLWSELGEGEKIGLYIANTDREEVAFVIDKIRKSRRFPLKEMVIFYRTHFQSRIFEDALIRERIPYTIIGGISFYMRREIKDILAFLHMIVDGGDFLSFARTINLPKRGIGETTLAKLRLFAEENKKDMLTLCQEIIDKKLLFKFSEKQLEGIKRYLQILLPLRDFLNKPLSELMNEIIERTQYVQILKEDPDTYEERRENIQELVSKAIEWEDEREDHSPSAFLQELSLKTSQDEKDPNQDSLRMMTLHHGKGLEFSLVFLVGMEEELFPHMNALGDHHSLEEERRLCYVGMTRAKENLYLTASKSRLLWGALRAMRPSRFLSEIPIELVHSHHIRSSFEEKKEEIFEPGDRVFHKDFGCGIVQKSYTTSFGPTYDIFFPEANSTRSLVAKFANLTTNHLLS